MYALVFVFAGASLFFVGKYFLLRYEVKRLHKQIDLLRENAEYGKRLYLEENSTLMANTIGAINRMVDDYENKLRRIGEMERNIRHSISSVSHDLRTPLTSLMGYLQLLSKEESKEKQREYLDAIFLSAGMLKDLTENFYELSRLDLDENTFLIQSLNLEHIICECFLSFYENFAGKQIELKIKDAEIPPVVLADIVALKRVLYNIIQNLLRYAQGQVFITFSKGGGYFAATIGNDTLASLPTDINRVFERFYTADPSRKDQSMGLGLYVSQKLIEGMGGEITASKDNNKFFITIKLRECIAISRSIK